MVFLAFLFAEKLSVRLQLVEDEDVFALELLLISSISLLMGPFSALDVDSEISVDVLIFHLFDLLVALTPHPVDIFVNVNVFILFFVGSGGNENWIVTAKHDCLVLVVLLQKVLPECLLGHARGHHMLVGASQVGVLLN